MAFAKGSLVMVDYTGRIKGGEVFETTRSEDAARPGRAYAPKLVSIGAGWVLKGLDEALEGAELDEDIRVEVPPEKGFGEVQHSKIRVMRSRKLGDDEEKVSVGDRVEIDGRSGVIRHMASGRIKVDFNHRHAGKTLVYEARVLRVVEEERERISAILDRHLPGRKEHIYAGGELSVYANDLHATASVKQSVRSELFQLVPTILTLSFVDSYENPAPAEPAASEPAASEPAAAEPPAGAEGPPAAEKAQI